MGYMGFPKHNMDLIPDKMNKNIEIDLRKQFEKETGHFVDFCKIEMFKGPTDYYVIWLENKAKQNVCEAPSSAERSVYPVLCAGLPCDDEVDQVATDESSVIDWNDLAYRDVYIDGFKAGALWMKSKIVNK